MMLPVVSIKLPPDILPVADTTPAVLILPPVMLPDIEIVFAKSTVIVPEPVIGLPVTVNDVLATDTDVTAATGVVEIVTLPLPLLT